MLWVVHAAAETPRLVLIELFCAVLWLMEREIRSSDNEAKQLPQQPGAVISGSARRGHRRGYSKTNVGVRPHGC